MKKLLKTTFGTFVITLLAIMVSSCSDGYSMDEFTVEWATVLDEDGFAFKLDDGTTLWAHYSAMSDYKPENKRVIINYTILSNGYEGYDHSIRLNSFVADVLTLEPMYVDPTNDDDQKKLGRDPLEILSIWESGGYLNVKFGYNTAKEQTHFLNLVSSNPTLQVDEDDVELELRHNQNGDSEKWGAKGFVSFDLEKYRVPGRSSINFKIKVKEFDKEELIEYDIVYNY